MIDRIKMEGLDPQTIKCSGAGIALWFGTEMSLYSKGEYQLAFIMNTNNATQGHTRENCSVSQLSLERIEGFFNKYRKWKILRIV